MDGFLDHNRSSHPLSKLDTMQYRGLNCEILELSHSLIGVYHGHWRTRTFFVRYSD